MKNIAPLVSEPGEDDAAIVFDNLIYGIMLNQIRKGQGVKRFQKIIQGRANILLTKKMTIQAVKNRADELKLIAEPTFWDRTSILELERKRIELRDLMKYAKDDGEAVHFTNFEDTWTERREGEDFDFDAGYEDYEQKVNSYFTTHSDLMPVYKLRHNQPLTEADYNELAHIVMEELGSKEDYERAFKDTPVGKLIRSIVKLDHDATMRLFATYIDEQKWNTHQIAFVKTLINYVEEHGYIEDMSVLLKPPFDKPTSFVRLYSKDEQQGLLDIVREINENAVRLVG